ncbi:hypothetical protein DSM104443_00769 [Usitatibacter rugosus]|uniref:DUF423 domain-containing protein n=1 Tax=Usitatibacter rugosus TaxID=2732067 RepID=A0A6M4GQU7_9PROT|nr:DUF423 domain-containing protein [Usitatibacter rugosus]QJR09719.1 hypothetical protein DSM104443_00769 [Usitatibacter rugosus]
MSRFFLVAGALVMAAGVAAGAYGAHAAKNAAHPEAVRLLQIAVLYHLVHGLAVVAVGLAARDIASRFLAAAGTLFLAGIVLFCGSLWALAMSGSLPLPTAPVGGLCFIAGWLAFAVGAFRSR